MKRIISVLLVLLMLIGLLAACGENKKKDETTDGSTSAGTGDDTGEWDGVYRADVPNVNYDGATFTIMCRSRDSDWAERAVFGDEDDETVLGSTTWYRNEKVAGMLNLDFVFEEINTKTTAGTFYNLILENSLSYDYICDICVQGVYDAMNLISTGIIANLDDVPYIDLDQPWWSQKLNESIRIADKQFFAINDMLLSDKLDTYALFFNKDQFDDNGLEYPYELVDSGDWTIDELKILITDFGYDLNNNGKKDIEDQFGMAYQRVDSFFTGFNILGASLDEDGIPHMNDFTDRIQTAYDKMYALRNNYSFNEWGYWDDGHEDDVLQTYLKLYPNCLFVCGPLSHYLDTIPHVEQTIGVVPSPKLDAAQDGYIGRAGVSGCTVITILNSTTDKERAGIVTEVLGAEAKNITSPAFYETLLTNRYAQDEESKRMISVIIESEVIDLDSVFMWGYMGRRMEENIRDKNPGVSSLYASLLPKASAALDKTVEAILEYSNQ